MAEGWICLDRNILSNWMWEETPFTKAQAWIDLLLLAHHKDGKILVNGNLIDVKRGQVITSQRKLSERWGWNKRTVIRFLSILESEKMLSQKCTTHYTALTIENYGKYQDACTTQCTTEYPQSNRQVHTYNNDNNDNNIKRKYIKEKPTKHKYGEYQNVLLTDDELERLKEKRPDNWKECIEILSEGKARKGYSYKSDYLAVLKWTEKEAKKGESRNDREQREDIRRNSESLPFN